MINVYSISEIIEASDKILRSPIKGEDNLPLDDKIITKKKETDVLINKPLILKNIEKKKDIPVDLEKIIVEAEKSQSKENVIENNLTKNKKKQNTLIEHTINQNDLIDDLYKKFGKKIKKNTLQLILELRKDIIFLTKDISTLKEKRIIEEQTNKKLTINIDDLKDIEENLKDNLDKSINGFNQLNYKHKNLKLNFNALEENSLNKELKLNESIENNNQLSSNLKRTKENFDSLYDKHNNLKLNFSALEEDLSFKQKKISISEEDNKILENKIKLLEKKLTEYKNNELTLSTKVQDLENHIFTNNTSQDELASQNKILEKKNIELKDKLDSAGHVDIYLQEINELKLKNKDLQNTIEKLKSYENSNDQNLNIIKELENKIKYYQEENIRISNQLYETNKRFDIIKNEIEVLQDQRSSLIAKINSVNDVIGNSKIVTNVFQNNQSQNNKVFVADPDLKAAEKQSYNIDEEISNIFNK